MRRARLLVAVVVGCGGGAVSAVPAVPEHPAVPAAPGASAAPASPAPGPPSALDPAAVLARIANDLEACLAEQRKEAPEAADGHLVLDAAIDASGHATCVVQSEASGLTLKAQECFVVSVQRTVYAPGAPTLTLALQVKGGAIQLLPPPKAPTLDNVEAEGLAGAGLVVQKMMPELRACVKKGLGEAPHMSGVLHVAARVNAAGAVTCAVVTRGNQVPDAVRECVASRLRPAKFAKPKWGSATLALPLKIVPGLR